jgi:hypothetical protein
LRAADRQAGAPEINSLWRRMRRGAAHSSIIGFGYLNPDRSVVGPEPSRARVDLDGHTRTMSGTTDTLRWRERWHLTLSGRSTGRSRI